jgi:hypothetical protein
LERKIHIQESVRHNLHYIRLSGTPHKLNRRAEGLGLTRPAYQARLFGLRVESTVDCSGGA